MSVDPVVRVRGLRTRFAQVEVLRGVDLEVRRGEVLVLIGPSGGGKTTLLRAINYLTPFAEGEVAVAGHRLYPGMSERHDAAALQAVRRQVGMVFQTFHLFPHLTVLGNIVEAPLRVLGLDPEVARRRAEALLARVGLLEHATAYPRTLSGGQQQRVAIARALAMEPQVLLFDEPTSALDKALVGEVLSVVADLAAAGQTMIIVTHELEFARRVANRVLVVAGGEIVEAGSAETLFSQPRSAVARSLLGRDA